MRPFDYPFHRGGAGQSRAAPLLYIAVIVLVLLGLVLPAVTQARTLGQAAPVTSNTDMTSSGAGMSALGFSAVGELVAAANSVSLAPASQSAGLLARQDYQNLYEQGRLLLGIGEGFRLVDLQLPPSCTGATIGDCQKNYSDFNNGRIFYRFCADFAQLDINGRCRRFDELSPAEQKDRIPDLSPQLPLEGEKDIRNKLVLAREIYGFLSLAEPAEVTIEVDGQLRPVRELGRSGVLTATRELATIHMIFGNEFMVDALDYRFSSGDPRADQIIAEEIRQLEAALEQFNLAVDVLAHAFNADFGGPGGVQIGDYFGKREFQLFGLVSERMVATIGEMADRFRQQGQDQKALDLYAKAFASQYVQVMALATSAAEQDQNLAENGGWEILNNMGKLRGRAQAIHDGVNPFGFVDEYVPLQTYAELRNLTRNDFLRDSTEDEDRAANAQREFDQNRTALNRELQNLNLTYNSQLLELCGATNDNFQTCDATGGLMRQNFHNIDAASLRILQVQKRIENLGEQMRIEQQRTNRVIEITLANGEQMALLEYEKGVIGAYRTTEAYVESNSDETYYGAELQTSTSVGFSFPPIIGKDGKGRSPFGFSASVTASASAGYRHSSGKVSSISTVWDPASEKLGQINSVQALQNAVLQAEITGANSEATIKNLMLQQSELLIELDIAFREWNRLVDEHRQLKERYQNLLNLRAQAQADVASSYFSNPAFRLLRDHTTVEAARSHGLAAQFAYLTAKALESEFLVRFPSLNNIFKARTADDIDNFLNELEAFRIAIGSPGELNRFPYRISLAKDLLGLSDENLDPTGVLSPSQRSQLRLEGFQRIIQQNVITDTATGRVIAIEIPFTTSLLDRRLFTPNIWNNRIAGVGLPSEVPGTQGIAVNLLTRQFGDIGAPEVQLTHGGHATFRTSQGLLVEYVPENAKLSGYPVPNGFESRTKTATILSSVNGNGRGTPSSAFFNRSVAASNWVLRIDLRSPLNNKLDVAQVEDIEINMDTTGIALANQVQAAQVDAANLQAAFEGE
jgi:hypothetical protein